jgi:hypothetical protein
VTGRGDLGTTGAALASTGAATTATLAAACCVPIVSPLIVASLGVGTAVWLAGLKPYTPYLLAGSFVVLSYGFWSVYGRRPHCRAKVRPGKSRLLLARFSILLLWLSAVVWLAATANFFLFS